jgi:hypothetical protein
MSRSLPPAQVARKVVDEAFDVHSPVLVLEWSDGGATERLWELPDGFSILGGAPRRFGLLVRRDSSDAYGVRILWDRTQLVWRGVSRLDLLGSCLAPLLSAVGLDLWSLLEQPIHRARMRHSAA